MATQAYCGCQMGDGPATPSRPLGIQYPAKHCLGIDGLYWYNGELLGVQYGTREY